MPNAETERSLITLVTYVMRILIADDHQVVRKGISSILRSREDFQVCGEASCGKEAVAKADLLKPDLVILDLSLPDLSGIEVATRIRKFLPHVSILLLSENDEGPLEHLVRETGLQGYVTKSKAGTTLLKAIDAILKSKQST